MGDASTGGLIDDLLMPTYYSGVLQRSSPKNYVMHPKRTQNGRLHDFWVTCPNQDCKRKFSTPQTWVFKYLERIGYLAAKQG